MILSFDVRPNSNALDTLWPVVANKEAIAVNQNWAGSVGALVKTWNPQEDNASAPECGNFDIIIHTHNHHHHHHHHHHHYHPSFIPLHAHVTAYTRLFFHARAFIRRPPQKTGVNV